MTDGEKICPKCETRTDEMFCPDCGTLTTNEIQKRSYDIDGSNKKIVEQIFSTLDVGDKIPKTDGGTRPVTKIKRNRIYMRVGVKTDAEKYITRNMLFFALEKIFSGESFDSNSLSKEFPKIFDQGSCVFSMTGGLLQFFSLAKKRKKGNGFVYLEK